MIPYIALQLKAVSASFRMILREESVLEVFDPTLVVAVTLALFGILFGARNLDFTKRQTGLMTAVAVESVVKLVAFLLVGRLRDLGALRRLRAISSARWPGIPSWSRLLTLDQAGTASYARWTAMLADLDAGGDVPAAAVPRARRPEPARARRQRGLLVLSALPAPDQHLRAAHRLRGPPRLPGGGRPGRRLHPPPAALLRQPAHLGARVPRRLLGRHRDDRGGLPRPVQDDHQRHHPAHAAAPAAHGGHLLDHPLLHPPGHAGGGGPGLRCGRAWSTVSSCWWRWGSCPSSRWPSARPRSCSASTGGAATGGAPSRASRPASSCGSTP